MQLRDCAPGSYFATEFGSRGVVEHVGAGRVRVRVDGEGDMDWSPYTEVTLLTAETYRAARPERATTTTPAERAGATCKVEGCLNPMRSATTGALLGGRGKCYAHWKAEVAAERAGAAAPRIERLSSMQEVLAGPKPKRKRARSADAGPPELAKLLRLP